MTDEILQKIDRIHPYPAKFPLDLAMKYIRKYTNEGDFVYDPFMGAGTTLLACSLLKRQGFGTDINHIGILISKFKLLKLNEQEINRLELFIEELKNFSILQVENFNKFQYDSINHWFCEDSISVLSFLKEKIQKLKNDKLILFCNLVLSSIINVVSNQESDTRYAAIEKKNLNVENILDIFIKKFYTILEIFKEFNSINRLDIIKNVQLLNAKDCVKFIENNTIDFILTSPPYINTYDYYLYHKHRMNWLEYDVKYSMNNEIGSRREFSSLKHDTSDFNKDLFEIFEKSNSLLKDNAKIVIVIGDGKVAGKMYDAKENIIAIASQLNWEMINYEFSLLDKTSRSFQKFNTSIGKKEHIITFKKVR